MNDNFAERSCSAVECRTLKSLVVECRTLKSQVVECRTLKSQVVECRTLKSQVVECRTLKSQVVECRTIKLVYSKQPIIRLTQAFCWVGACVGGFRNNYTIGMKFVRET